MTVCPEGAEAAKHALEDTPELDATRQAHLLLWKATGDRTHLVEATRLLRDALSKVPETHHAAMLANVRVNREIDAAAREAGLWLSRRGKCVPVASAAAMRPSERRRTRRSDVGRRSSAGRWSSARRTEQGS